MLTNKIPLKQPDCQADQPFFSVWPAGPARLMILLGLVRPVAAWLDLAQAPDATANDIRDWLAEFIDTRGLTSRFAYLPEYDYAELAIVSPGLPYDDGRLSNG